MHKTEIGINGSKCKSIPLDISWKSSKQKNPIIIFCHGFKGFKNWGHFDLIANKFAENNFTFIKFNFSYNGTTLELPIDFADLDAFGNNNFSTELNDLGLVIDYIEQNAEKYNGDINSIFLIGHSRGGGIAILKSYEDNRIKKLVTWASIKDVADFILSQNIEQWEQTNVVYTFNTRTQQNMPLYYQLYEDYILNKTRLNIPKTVVNINIPWLIAHGTNDGAVPFSFAEQLHTLNNKSELFLIENADHTFGGKHPWSEKELPIDTKYLVEKTINFLNAN